MYQVGGTLIETVRAIQNNNFVLPAIQREFVWGPRQIEKLFDSLMQGYPFGTFLYWKVDRANSSKYKFYGFVRDYHERNNPHCPELAEYHETELTAVLDGQQRLTALNIGLNGSMAWRTPYQRKNNPEAYPVSHLYLNLLATEGDGEEDGEKFAFKFLTDSQVKSADGEVCWFRVRDILGMQSGPGMLNWITRLGLTQAKTLVAFTTLDTLYQAVHNRNPITYYEEKSQELGKVLNIFVRTNSGGTALSYSDLLLSIAVAQWDGDARKEIYSLVDELNDVGEGFRFTKDFVLKAGLMLAGIGNVGFKVENFNRENMRILEQQWPEVKRSLRVAVQLAASFGFNERTLRADSALLPVAYYVHHRGLDRGYLTKSTHGADRDSVRQWLTRSLLKASGIWGSGLDSLLTATREVIREHGQGGFPAARLQSAMALRGKSLAFTEEEVGELVEMEYGDKRLFALLGLLFPFVVTTNHFHIDHIFPKSLFSPGRLKRSEVPEGHHESFREKADLLPNLQLLEGTANLEKLDAMPAEWMARAIPTPDARTDYVKNHLLGEVPEIVSEFGTFYEARRTALRERIEAVLGVGEADPGVE